MRLSHVLTAILVLLAVSGSARADPIAQWQLCVARDGRLICSAVDPGRLRLDAPVTELRRTIDIAVAADGSLRPLAVDLDAMASAEISWNAVPIGANGRVGPDAASEVPGLFSASIPVPARLVRPGPNVVVVRLSAHHLWLPVGQPIHRLAIGPPDDPVAYTLRHYLPALTVLVLPAMALLIVLSTAWRRGRIDNVWLVVIVLACVLTQGMLETSKLAIAYPYPWHLARLVGLSGLAAIVSVMIAALAARRFVPTFARRVKLIVIVLAVTAILFVPGWDQKALAALQAGLIAAAGCAVRPAWRGDRMAILALALTGGAACWSLIAGPDFLDGGYYVMAGLGAVLICLWATLAGEAGAASQPTNVLPPASVVIHEGTRQHIVDIAEIAYLKAADDYCAVHLVSGREILASTSLAGLLVDLPATFARIHRGHAINLAHLRSVRPAGKGTRVAELVQGVTLPVGRTYSATFAHVLASAGGGPTL